MPHHHDDGQPDAEFYDLTAFLIREPEPEELDPPAVLMDPNRPPASWMMNSKPRSRKAAARRIAWRTSCAITQYRDHMVPSDVQMMTAIVKWCRDNGSDTITMRRDELAAMAGLHESTARNALYRLTRDDGLVVVESGRAGRPSQGKKGTGKTTVYRITGTLSDPTSRRSVVGRPLGGQAEPDRVTDVANSWTAKDSKESKYPSTSGFLVGTYHEAMRHPIAEGDATSDTESVQQFATSDTTPDQESVQQFATSERFTSTEWLAQRLAEGPEMVATLLAEWAQVGGHRATLYRAAKNLNVTRTSLTGFAGGRGKPPLTSVMWELP